MRSGWATARRRLLGLAFFLVLILFVSGSIAVYQKVFKDVVKVQLVTDSAGNNLPDNADVKVRGVIVGEVRKISPQGTQVNATLALTPAFAEKIPSNVTARLLPKTLFGEKYVALMIPDNDNAKPISAGDTIQQDKSGNAVEVGQLLDGLLPLLQSIPPQDLANTLGALSQGLSGRGEELGKTIDRLDEVVSGINTELPNLQQALRSLATFSQTYSDAAPQLIDAFDALRTTGNTVVEQQDQIRTLLATLNTTSVSTADFLEANRDSVISIAADSKEALQILAKYSGTFGCTFANFAPLAERAKGILGLDTNLNPTKYPGARTKNIFLNPRGRYLPNQDEPRLLDTRGPRCYDPPSPGVKFGQYPGGSINDGSYQPPSRNPGPQFIPDVPIPQYAAMPAAAPGAPAKPVAYAGSDFERNTLATVYASTTGMAPQDVPGWATLIGAPAMRGSEVTVK